MRSAPWVIVIAATLAACSTHIADGLDERQSREVMAALGRAGIAAEREASGDGDRYAIGVPAADASRAMAALEAAALPREREPGLAGLYGSASMIPTPTEEKARFIDALDSEIAAHLRGLDGVLDASVIVTAPVNDPLAPPDAPRLEPTASVLIRSAAGGAPVNEDHIRALVAGAVEGLQGDAVTVVMSPMPPPPAVGSPLFVKVGPIAVTRSSKGTLQAVLAAALLLVIGLGVWALWTERRRAELRRQLDALERREAA